MDSNTKASSLLIQVISSLVEKLVVSFLREQQVICTMGCVVVSEAAIGATTKLYLPPDLVNPSLVNYTNHTGTNLLPGQKVYLLYKFGDISQGWIAHT